MEASRENAFKKGKKKYNSEKLCKKHGLVERYTASGGCVVCQKAASKKWIAEASEALKYLRYLDNGGAGSAKERLRRAEEQK